jgi:hypothetical protein
MPSGGSVTWPSVARSSSASSSFDLTDNWAKEDGPILFYGPTKLAGTGFGGLGALHRKLIWDETSCLAATRRLNGSIPQFTLVGPQQCIAHAKKLARIYMIESQKDGLCQHLPDTPESEKDYSSWFAYKRRRGIDPAVLKRKAVSKDRAGSSQPQPLYAPPGLQQRVRK